MTSQSSWRRVTRSHSCSICGKPDWCLYTGPEEDPTAAICARVESSKRIGDAGWLHRLKETPERQQRRLVRVIRPAGSAALQPDLERLAAQYRDDLDPGRLYQLAASLGLSVPSLCHLGIGWSTDHRAWSFPMSDVHGNVLGIRLRRPDGVKFAVRGGKEGLFLPSTVGDESSPLLICEGPTDAAALLDLGFRNVVGRPSCAGGIKLLVELVQVRHCPEVIIVADADTPGKRGAANLAVVLLVYAPTVRVIEPPEGIKDTRVWLLTGGTHQDVERAINAASVRRLVIRAGTPAQRKGR